MMYWVKITDSVGVTWHPYKSRTEAEAYALSADGVLYENIKADVIGERIENAVSKYLEKKQKHIVI